MQGWKLRVVEVSGFALVIAAGVTDNLVRSQITAILAINGVFAMLGYFVLRSVFYNEKFFEIRQKIIFSFWIMLVGVMTITLSAILSLLSYVELVTLPLLEVGGALFVGGIVVLILLLGSVNSPNIAPQS